MPVAALLTPCQRGRLALILLLVALFSRHSLAQDLPRCGERPTVILGELYTDRLRWCPEHVVHARDIEAFAFTALAVAPDGALYATRPLAGEVTRITDSDGDGLPDSMRTFVSGLTLPNGLAYHAGYLYIAGGAHLYRADESGAVETLIDDLPTGAGFWTGGIAIDADERLYIAMGAPCGNCEFNERERGAILSVNLAGGERQIAASGFRNPSDVAVFRGQLWTLDSAPRQPERTALDELNRVEAGGFYGFPYCLGADTTNITDASGGCAQSIPPVMQFGSGSLPISLAAYPHASLPGTADTLVVALNGDPSQVDTVGYKVIMITFDERSAPLGATILLPYLIESQRVAYQPYADSGLFWDDFIHINEIGFGIYPQQPLAVAVAADGTIYISITGGRIIALRPRHEWQVHPEFHPVWSPLHPDFDPSQARPPLEN